MEHLINVKRFLNVFCNDRTCPPAVVVGMCMGVFLGIFMGTSGCRSRNAYVPRNGDLVFQVSPSSQSRAIQLATGSKYSHMGIVYLNERGPEVLEAVGPVRIIPLDQWIAQGVDGHYAVKRLKTAGAKMTPQTLERMHETGREFIGKPYDWTFEWSDDRMYCSELVWKIYKRGAGIEIGPRRRMREFDLSHPAVKAKLRERYGDAVPLDEWVVSPGDMFASDRLVTVYRR